jgi:peroxiredoxin
MPVKWVALLLVIVAGATIALAGPLQAKDPSPANETTSACDSFGIQRFQPKKEAPLFSLKSLNGQQFTLNEYKGKPVLLFFWGSFCLACKEDIALLEVFSKKNRGQVEILTIVIDGEKERKVKNVVKDFQITLPVLLDYKEKLARTYGVKMIPTSFLINGEGLVEGMIVGQRDWCAPDAFSAIRETLNLR